MSTNSTPSDDRQTRLDDDRGTVFEDGTSRFTASARPSRHYHPDALILDGKYRLVEELRSGNQARAFRGVRVADSATVFVKILHNPTVRPDYFAKLSTLRERILAVDHPSLLRCYDFEGNGEAWIEVYEFAEGQTLTEWNQSHHPASDGEVRTALEQLSNAIHFLHASLGLAHRDIKPDNIHVSTKEGGLRLKLLDYGTVSALETGGVTLVVGTKLYSPPESYGRYIRNDALLEKWDWFSLGRIIQEMVDGVHAYDRIAGVFAEEIARRADHAAAVQEKFDSIMMEFDYDRNRIWAGMVELSEENPGRAVWIPLLKGLLTSSRQLRWGHEEIVAFLAGRVPRYFYGTKAREEGFEYRGVKWDLVSLASHLSCAERWPEARDLLYKGLLRHHIRNELKIADLDEQIDRDVALRDRDIATALVLTRLGEGSLNPSIAGFRLDREYVKHVVDSSSALCAMLWDRGKHLRALTSPSLEGRLASLPQVASRDALGSVGSLAREISEFTRELDRLGVPYSAKDFTSDPSIPLKFILATRRDLETEIAGFRRTEFSHTTKAELQSVYGTDDLSGSPPATVQALRFAIFHHNENGFITYRSQAEALHNQARHIKYGLLWRQVRDLVEPVYAPWLGTEKVVFWAWAIAVFILAGFALQKGQVDTSSLGSSVKVFFLSGVAGLLSGVLALAWRSRRWSEIENWAKRQLPAGHAIPSPQTASQIATTRAAEYLRQVSPDLEHASAAELRAALSAKNNEIARLRTVTPGEFRVEAEPWSMGRSPILEAVVFLLLLPLGLYFVGRVQPEVLGLGHSAPQETPGIRTSQAPAGPSDLSHIRTEHRDRVQSWLRSHPEYRVLTRQEWPCFPSCEQETRDIKKAWPLFEHPYYAIGDFNKDHNVDFAIAVYHTASARAAYPSPQYFNEAVVIFNGPLRSDSPVAFFGEHLGRAPNCLLFHETDKPGLLVGPWASEGAYIRPTGTGYAVDKGSDAADASVIDFVPVPRGDFQMGCSVNDAKCEPNEKPAHSVRIAAGYEIGKYEVTQAQWESVMGMNPSRFKGASLPVESVSWKDVQSFIGRLNQKQNQYRYRLPTEAEWEYAARAGTAGAYWGPEGMDWYDPKDFWESKSILRQQTRPVGSKKPNPWGLYDTLGNVWEWTQDSWVNDYSTDPPPEASDREAGRALRGGACYNGLTTCATRVSQRIGNGESQRNVQMGFRLVREAVAKRATSRSAEVTSVTTSASEPLSVEAFAKRIEAQIDSGSYDNALREAENAVRVYPNSTRARGLLDRVRRIRSILK